MFIERNNVRNSTIIPIQQVKKRKIKPAKLLNKSFVEWNVTRKTFRCSK